MGRCFGRGGMFGQRRSYIMKRHQRRHSLPASLYACRHRGLATAVCYCLLPSRSYVLPMGTRRGGPEAGRKGKEGCPPAMGARNEGRKELAANIKLPSA